MELGSVDNRFSMLLDSSIPLGIGVCFGHTKSPLPSSRQTQNMSRITYTNSRGKAIYWLLLAVGLLTLVIVAAWKTDKSLDLGFGWIGVGLSIFLAICSLMSLLDNRPQLILTENLLIYRDAELLWPEITNVEAKIRSYSMTQRQLWDDQTYLKVDTIDRGTWNIDLSPLSTHGEEIFQEIERLWIQNRGREDLIVALEQRATRQLAHAQQVAIEIRESADTNIVFFGTELYADGTTLPDDWKNAMRREYPELSETELDEHFSCAKRLSSYSCEEWESRLREP